MQRYAVYYAPRPGEFADRAAEWLSPNPVVGPDDLPAMTVSARRYGFHGTLRAPFRLATDLVPGEMMAEVEDLAGRLVAAKAERLQLQILDGFLAVTPAGSAAPVDAFAAAVVDGTDHLRAPLTPEDRARRRPEGLTERQRDLLDRWGYPYVMEEFRFHLTLTDQLPPERVDEVMTAAEAHFGTVLPRPFVIEDLCLFCEAEDGQFHLLHRYPLSA